MEVFKQKYRPKHLKIIQPEKPNSPKKQAPLYSKKLKKSDWLGEMILNTGAAAK